MEDMKCRTIKVSCEGCEKKLNESIGKIKGVKKVSSDKNGVRVEYDLMQVKLETIEKAIVDLGYGLKSNILEKMKRGLIHDAEDNEFENMTRPAAPCCSNPKL